MAKIVRALVSGIVAAGMSAGAGFAQSREAPTGWIWVSDGLAAIQGSTDLDQGGTFSSRRALLSGGGIYRFQSGNSVGVLARIGRLDYDFDAGAAAPWSGINDLRLSVPMRFRTGERVSVFVAPSLRYDYESGSNRSDGRSYGAFGGITWEVSNRLTIGPGIGAFTEIGTDDWDVFPALLVDWQIADRWNLSTGSGAGATQGPGLSLSYEYSDALTVSLGARYESLRFRLDNSGVAPGGVGEENSVPVVISARYAPNPGMTLSGFIGAELNGSLQIENGAGALISRQNYDTAPVAGLSFRLAF